MTYCEVENRRYKDGWRHGWLDASLGHCSIIATQDPMTPLAYRDGYKAGQRAHKEGMPLTTEATS